MNEEMESVRSYKNVKRSRTTTMGTMMGDGTDCGCGGEDGEEGDCGGADEEHSVLASQENNTFMWLCVW
jgi:hypothetical protein